MRLAFGLFSVLGMSLPAAAHAGDHHGLDLMAALTHFFTQPFHILGLCAVFAAAFGVRQYMRRKAGRRISKSDRL